MHQPPTFLTVSDAARLAGVSAQTIRAWERTGRVPAIRTASGVRLFEREVVQRVAETRRHTEEPR